MEAELTNRVANSTLITINLEDFLPTIPIAVFDLKEQLFMGLVLKEADFRSFLKTHDWQQYWEKAVAITCSADAIIPTWAYMLVVSYLVPVASFIHFGTAETLPQDYLRHQLNNLVVEPYKDQKIVIKGCANKAVPVWAYLVLTQKLTGVAQKIMYGEPCSTVPIYKR